MHAFPSFDDAPGRVILLALVGSHAYGTDHERSDHDYRGVFVTPTRDLLRLREPKETYTRDEPDTALHELRKFVRLAANGNPTVLEVLFAEEFSADAAGQRLRDARSAFLSRRLVHTYGGYARQQLAKAKAGSGGSRGVKHLRREKFILHLYRLMDAGTHALATGDLTLRVQDPEALWAKARQPLDAVERDFEALDARLQAAAASSPLPDAPDHDVLDQLMLSIRGL